MKVLVFLIVIIAGGCSMVFSQTANMPEKENVSSSHLHISGKVLITNKDTVNLLLYPYYSEFRMQLDAIKFSSPANNGNFTFNLPSINRPYYVSLFLSSNSNKKNTFNLFLIEPGDSIHFFITMDTIEFSGKESEKFVCQYEMQQVMQLSFSKAELLNFYPKLQGYKFNKYRESKMDSLLNAQLQILEKYKYALSNLVYERLKVDYFYKELYDLYSSLQFGFHVKADSLTRAEQIRFFKNLESRKIMANISENISFNSRTYTDFLIMKSLTAILVKKYQRHSINLYRFSWTELFDYFQEKFSGLIKEKLLAISAYSFYKSYGNENEKFLDIALNQASQPYFKNILQKVKDLRTAGSPAYPFLLYDTTGKLVKLSDFAGKVIVMDFWFTGCPNCIDLEKQMIFVRNKFENNKNVVFLSVSLDKNKQTWLKSVNRGLYSGIGSINLYTNGEGEDNPLIKHYDIKGCPELIIIDRSQKNFSTNPVRPQNEITTERFITLIQNTVDKN